MSLNYQSLMGTSDLDVDSLAVDTLVVQKDMAVLGDTQLNTATIQELTIPGGTLDSVLRSDATGVASWTRGVDLDSVRTGAFELTGGNVYDVLMNTGSGTQWTPDISLRTLLVSTQFTLPTNAVADQIWTCTNALGEGEWRVPATATLAGDATGPSNANAVNTLAGGTLPVSTLVTLAGTQALTNKDVTVTSLKVPTGAASGKVLTSDALGAATWQVIPTQTMGGDISGPATSASVNSLAGGTIALSSLATLTGTQALTGKTITGTTNSVDANTLRNGSTWALALAGAAPATNNVLTYNGTNAVWAAPTTTSSVTMGGNVTGASSACTVVGAAGNFAVVGNETVGGTLGVTGRTTTAGLTTTLSMYYTAMNKKMFDLQDLGTVTNQSQHNFDGIGMDGVNAINYQAKNTSTSHVFNAATSSTSSNTLMTINGDGTVSVPGSFTKFAVRDTSQQIRLYPTTNNAESSISFNTNTGGPAFGLEWTMGQGAYSAGVGNFGMGVGGGIGNVLTIDGTTGYLSLSKGLTISTNATFGAKPASSVPTIVTGTAAGTSPFNIGVYSHSGMVSGRFYLGIGSSPAANGILCELTFPATFPGSPGLRSIFVFPALYPSGAAVPNLLSNPMPNGNLRVEVRGTALTTGQTYEFVYFIVNNS